MLFGERVPLYRGCGLNTADEADFVEVVGDVRVEWGSGQMLAIGADLTEQHPISRADAIDVLRVE